METYTDLAQLKKFKPIDADAVRAPAAAKAENVDKELAAASSSSDYFSSLLGVGKSKDRAAAPAPRRATVVTPATIARVREQQAADTFAAERASLEACISALTEELEAQKAATASVARDLAEARAESYSAIAERERELAEKDRRLADKDAALVEKDGEIASLREAMAAKDAKFAHETARLENSLEEARSTSLSTPVLLEKPDAFGEKFRGELREHVLDAIAQSYRAAEAAGHDRRARILEAVLVANPMTGELDARREAVKQILKDAGSALDDSAVAELERLGFRYVSGNRHHKLDWAGIRFPLSKTPGDRRAALNSAAEIVNRVF